MRILVCLFIYNLFITVNITRFPVYFILFLFEQHTLSKTNNRSTVQYN